MLTTRSTTRAFVACIVIGLLTLAFVLAYGAAFYERELPLALYSALILLPFSALIMESYFTKPNDVIANSISLLVLMVPLASLITQQRLTYLAICSVAFVALVLAVVSNAIFDPRGTTSSRRNAISASLKEFAVRIGAGRVLFGGAAVVLLINERNLSSPYYIAALIFVFIFLALDVGKLADGLRRVSRTPGVYGKIIGVQGDNLAIGSAPQGRPQIGQRAVVRIADETLSARVVAHHRLHNDSRTALALMPDTPVGDGVEIPPPGTYSLLPTEHGDAQVVGLANAHSNILTLKFRQLPHSVIRVGNIVACEVEGATVYYQVQDARLIEDPKAGEDATDYVEVTAAQIGRWNDQNSYFERFGWLPRIFSDVFRPTEFPKPLQGPGEFQIGTIPDTGVPVFLNIEEAVTHHTAVLGVTGVGKSVFVRDLIQRLACPEMKFLCVDLTREYITKFEGKGGSLLIDEPTSKSLSAKVNELGQHYAEYRNKRDTKKIDQLKTEVVKEFRTAIEQFAESPDRHIGILELGDLDGSLENLEYLKWFFRSVFIYAKLRKVKEPKICLVLEEAHTIIPEWNFMGSEDRSAGNVVNNIAQVALQGRKYGVGIVVVAQRTANVSKTVLTQCNTVIAFQQFDKTSFDFLESFVGGDAARVLPTLKPRTAIATGKAIRATTPLIFEVPELDDV